MAEQEKILIKYFTINNLGKEILQEIKEIKKSDHSLFFQEFFDYYKHNPIAIMDKCYEPIVDEMSYSSLDKNNRVSMPIYLNKKIVDLLDEYKKDHGIPMVRIFLAMNNFYYKNLPKGFVSKNTSSKTYLSQEGVILYLTNEVADKLVAVGKKYGYYNSTILKLGLKNLKSSSLPKIEDDKTSKIGRRNFERLVRISPPIHKDLISLYEKNKDKNYSRVNITEVLINSAEIFLEKLI